jgi:hypothetical protein
MEMNTREHMENLAQRYADAMVRYHLSDTADTTDMAALHDMLFRVTMEYAEELKEEA